MQNFKLVIEYDGTGYHGWQRQKHHRTIQEEIETALRTMTRQRVTLHGSGRTDAGVHALGQVASFRCDTRLTAGTFLKGLNSLLADDIVIRSCETVSPDFHARFSARGKTYHYRILNRPLAVAIGRQYAWFIRSGLDTDAMQEAAAHLTGRHDFRAFEGAGSPRSHTVRHLREARFIAQGEGYSTFRISGDGFLRYMVRNIVGTLVETGTGKRSPEEFREVLRSGDRNLAGPTAPAHGLFLMHVNYEEIMP